MITIKNYKNILNINKIQKIILLTILTIINFAIISNQNLICETKSLSESVLVNQNGKSHKINLDFINNVRYIDISKIPDNIIENSKYNPNNYSITSKDIKIQFLPGSFYYTIDNLEEVKIVQMYMPIISKVVNKKTQLIIPFVSFVKSLDSIGLYDISFDNNTINIKSKVTNNEFAINFPLKFPKLNVEKSDLSSVNNLISLNKDYKQSEMMEEDFWDEEKLNYANDNYNKSKNINEDLENNEIADVINNIAAKVFASVKSIDENTKDISLDFDDKTDNKSEYNKSKGTNSGVKSSGSNSRFKSYFRPKYARRTAYTDPFLELRPASENDNIKFKVDRGEKQDNQNDNDLEDDSENEKSENKSKKTFKNKSAKNEVKSNNSKENSDDENSELENENQNINSKTKKDIKENYYIPKNLKRPGIDF